ncbi:NAD(P)-dependent oxidoreductase [Persicitalea sp.]|uniref:NAD(P)-dependent oxidoreductase n=1 Tax=Persicitalea sp. TaxID=3100273 RepID=UPI0035934534
MKLLVFGASGATGIQVVKQALEQGHFVTAFVRNPAKIEIKNANLDLVQGNVMDASSVRAAFDGHDAVLNCLGTSPNKVGTIRSDGTANILRAMEQTDTRRIIVQTTLGFGDSVKSLDQTPWFFKYIIVPFLLKKTFADHERQEEIIRQSSLNWTIVRPGGLTNGERTEKYRHGFAYDDETIKASISRADVADFMLNQLTSEEYVRKITGLSY